MDSSTSGAPSSAKPRNNLNEKNKVSEDMVTITETISLTKNQHRALKIVCDIYEQSSSEYIKEAVVQTMRSDIEQDNLSSALLKRLDDDGPKGGKSENEKSRGDEDNNNRVPSIDSTIILEELDRLTQKIPKLDPPQ